VVFLERAALKKKYLRILVVAFFTLFFVNTTFAWQGRMDGMDNPIGLVNDESDFLIHPAKLVNINDNHYYADYKFDYHHVDRWDNTFTYGPPSLIFPFPPLDGGTYSPFSITGSERDHNTSVGGTWRFGPGQLGVFLQYSLQEASFDGTVNYSGSGMHPVPVSDRFAFDIDSENFAVRFLYGLPIETWKFGAEIGFAHKSHQNTTTQFGWNGLFAAYPPIGLCPTLNSLVYRVPDDSSWNESNFKISAEKQIGPGMLTFTPRISTIFDGVSKVNAKVGILQIGFADQNSDGRLAGWNTGADLWYRIQLDKATDLPILIRAEYDLMNIDIPGFRTGPQDVSHDIKNILFETGGGIDRKFGQTRIAAGVFYNYIEGRDSYTFAYFSSTFTDSESQHEKEHRIVLKLSFEQIISPEFTTRFGVSPFYGWVKNNYLNSNHWGGPFPYYLDIAQDISTSGHRLGVTASAGATLKVAKIAIEPFISGAIQKTAMDTKSGLLAETGSFIPDSQISADMQSRKTEWSVSGGLSIKY
jgi:hypothetical protein